MNTLQLADLSLHVGRLTRLIDIRNFSRLEARKGTEANREAWVLLYRDTVVRIKGVEAVIGRQMPIRQYKRVAGKVKP